MPEYVFPIVHRKLIVEKRHEDGSLDFSEPQPPSWMQYDGVSADRLCDYWFRHNPGAERVSQDTVIRWFMEKGWQIRAKTW